MRDMTAGLTRDADVFRAFIEMYGLLATRPRSPPGRA